MTERPPAPGDLRHDHPIFFWGVVAVVVLLVVATAAVGVRIPRYRHDASVLQRQMTAAERETRDRVLESRANRAQLALALLRYELRLKSLQEKGLHLAINTEESSLALRHGNAELRRIPIEIGHDSVIRAPDGRSWRFVRGLGERRVVGKAVDPAAPVPEWVYVSRGEPVPPEAERSAPGITGHFVLRLDDGSEIYSRPETGPLRDGVKPAAFVASAPALQAIFDAIGEGTPVYIY